MFVLKHMTECMLRGLEGYKLFLPPPTADGRELSPEQLPPLKSSSFSVITGSRSAHSEQKGGSGI